MLADFAADGKLDVGKKKQDAKDDKDTVWRRQNESEKEGNKKGIIVYGRCENRTRDRP